MQEHRLYVSEHGEDLPEVSNWTWAGSTHTGADSKAAVDAGGDNA
jgi:xylulose-5-phosphate/fructose-6-phosphate phosphoketolase